MNDAADNPAADHGISDQPSDHHGPCGKTRPAKFRHPDVTADGQPRAKVRLERLKTLWVNSGTLCNLTCANCYIESSPRNDRLAYITAEEVRAYLDEVADGAWGTEEIGITGGEPFMNPWLPAILHLCLERGYRVLLLTNAMRPMMKRAADLLSLKALSEGLILRVSLDHYSAALHEAERGSGSWESTLKGLRWLCSHGFRVDVAGRLLSGESEERLRSGYQALFDRLALPIDARDPEALVLFPEMNAGAAAPEISENCWRLLDREPREVMCASSRMILKRKGAAHPVVVSCTLLPYAPAFELGRSLAEAALAVSLNHPYCAQFCVLGGARCSRR